MEQPDLKYLKTVIRSILTSSPGKVTISQILNDYPNYEGCNLTYNHLGFKTIFELLENMNDVLKIPSNPSMSSFITLIVDKKTSHLRELVVNQKTKKQRPRRSISFVRSGNSSHNLSLKSANFKSRSYNNNKLRTEYSTPKYERSTPRHEYTSSRYDYSARGYDHVKIKSNYTKPIGTVTQNLRSCVEDLCNTSKVVGVNALKNCLINHPDYKKLGTTNVEESINMLKYFIYIDKGGVHLKDSPFEIFPSKTSGVKNDTISTSASCLNSIVNEDEEISYDELNDNDYGEMDDLNFEDNDVYENDHEISQNSTSITHNDNTILLSSISPQNADSCEKLYTDDSLSQLHEPNQLATQNLVNMVKTDLNDPESNNNDTVPAINNNNKRLLLSKVFTPKPFHNKIVSNIQHKTNGDNKIIPNSSKTPKDDYKSAIVAIIARSSVPITVKEVLATFENNQGYTFPFQKFSCGTYMDFFRLYPDMFRLDDQCSTNSIVSLEKQIILVPKISLRKQFTSASIFNNVGVTNLQDNSLNQEEIISTLLSNKDDDQNYIDSTIDKSCQTHCEKSIVSYEMYDSDKVLDSVKHNLQNNSLNQKEISTFLSNKDDDQNYKDSTIDKSCQTHCEKSIVSYEMYDSDKVLDSMKHKMRHILSKHKDGILCNNFMDVYGNEYNSHFNFSEYGFSSMRDMAYKLPSVFYVKVTEDNYECILFEANRRSELENNMDDPSLYYKNIPKTILLNLSSFFKKYQTGVKFDEMMTLYCTEYGRAYEPLKYGYSSEKHMFESLDKMVEIENNKLYTKNPFAYTKLLQDKDHIDKIEVVTNSVVLPDHDFLLHYSGKDICNGRFKYPKIKLNDQKCINVIIAEIYSPSSFYIQIAANVNNLNSFMDSLQLYYNENEVKYKVIPKLILPELACTSCFEDSGLWHRAIVVKIIDEENVQLFYVDYGSVEIVPKSNVRLLASQFGVYPSQAVHCGLYEYNELNYPREISESFAEMVEAHELEAKFHPSKSKDDSEKLIVTLFLKTKSNKMNINKNFSKEVINHFNKRQESVRRMIYKIMATTDDD